MFGIRYALLAAGFTICVASVASAADMPTKGPVYKAPVVAPVHSWTGFYVGGEVGARWANNDWQSSDLFPHIPGIVQTAGTSGSMNNVAPRLGGYLGYNRQFAKSWVAGIETDIGWANSSKYANPLPGTPNANAPTNLPFGTVKETWDGSVRGRLGYLVASDILLYSTGGVAWQGINLNASCNAVTFSDFCTRPHNENYTKIKAGWTIGSGMDWRLWGHWLARIEYRYANFGTFDQTFFTRGIGFDDRFTAHVKVQTHTANIGLAYKF